MTSADDRRFLYDGFDIDTTAGSLRCRYSLGDRRFTERVTIGPGAWDSPASRVAARLVFLLAGVSYFKTAAPKVIDLGTTATTPAERALLRMFYVEGLAEFSYVNDLDLSDLVITGPEVLEAESPDYHPEPDRPLVPFGGGIDSIVTADAVADRHPTTALFIVNRPNDRFAAIERPASVTGLPVVRATREIDPLLLQSTELGFLNGHVPVTGILSAIAVLAAVVSERSAVVMSNERSASAGNLMRDGRPVNHQWSKSLEFETAFRQVLAESLGNDFEYYSYLRPCSELWVGQRFALLEQFHGVFRSCNRNFSIDPARRIDAWCAECDKCVFIDLVLSPFLTPGQLAQIFEEGEPLADARREEQFRTLCGLGEDKPFECVGDEEECRGAVLLAAARPDRSSTALLQGLAADISTTRAAGIGAHPDLDQLLRPSGAHFIPADDAPDLLV